VGGEHKRITMLHLWLRSFAGIGGAGRGILHYKACWRELEGVELEGGRRAGGELLGALARRANALVLDVLVLELDALVLDAGQLLKGIDAVSELRRSEAGQVPVNR
jgi:hypothetical protein